MSECFAVIGKDVVVTQILKLQSEPNTTSYHYVRRTCKQTFIFLAS